MSIYNLSVMTDPPDSNLYTRCTSMCSFDPQLLLLLILLLLLEINALLTSVLHLIGLYHKYPL